MKPYRECQTITRQQAFARGFDGKWLNAPWPNLVYRYKVARTIFIRHQNIMAVDFCQPKHQNKDHTYVPLNMTTGIYVMSRCMVVLPNGQEYRLNWRDLYDHELQR